MHCRNSKIGKRLAWFRSKKRFFHTDRKNQNKRSACIARHSKNNENRVEILKLMAPVAKDFTLGVRHGNARENQNNSRKDSTCNLGHSLQAMFHVAKRKPIGPSGFLWAGLKDFSPIVLVTTNWKNWSFHEWLCGFFRPSGFFRPCDAEHQHEKKIGTALSNASSSPRDF